jgi:ribosomal protein S12 methylthiotransferase accessory factor
MTMHIAFPGGTEINAAYKGFVIHTHGGGSSAPTPFDLFLTALGSCAGYYALAFCRERALPTAGLALSLDFEPADDGKRLAGVRIAVELPGAFPAKYRAALLRAIDTCAVKRALEAPPHFESTIAEPERAIA